MVELIICTHCGVEVPNGEICCMGDPDDVTFLCKDCYEDHTVSCMYCDERIWNDNNMGSFISPLCKPCFDYHSNKHYECEDCGCLMARAGATVIDGKYYCQQCIINFVTCDHCGLTIRASVAETDNSHHYCQDCYNTYYVRCYECDSIISRDNANYFNDSNVPYCESCYDNSEEDEDSEYDEGDGEDDVFIHDYHYKPEPDFFGMGSRYFGIELEIDHGGKLCENARKLINVANIHADTIYIKSDGSLECGLEIVTHPMTLEYHMQSMRWQSLLVQASELGYKSHMTDTCGLHIHVNRNSFTDSHEYQEECIARVLYLVERFWEELLRFSRRTQSQLKRWANRYGYKEKPEDILDSAKHGYGGRYTCVNLTNDNTIEFRIFRGTLKYNTLIATLQLVNEICDVAFSMSDEEIGGLSWCDLMERISPEECPELIQYLKERRLYINEPVLCEAEV